MCGGQRTLSGAGSLLPLCPSWDGWNSGCPACQHVLLPPWAISLTFLSLFDKGDYGVSLEVTSDKVKTGTTWWQEEPIYSTSGVSGEIPKLWVYTRRGGG